MPSIAENKRIWTIHDWSNGGDEWSEQWGTAQAQWISCIHPRIFPFLKGRVLEIAPGYGRWTQFLTERCSELIGVDLVENCDEHCRRRFSHVRHLTFEVNDGLTLPMVQDASIDFAFSFDSLVHAEADVMASYARELARVLKPSGIAFLHHSNLGGIRHSFWHELRRRRAGAPYYEHWRAPSMSAAAMRQFVQETGMSCVQQELVSWGYVWPLTIDCMTTIVRKPGEPCRVFENAHFREEAAAAKRIAALGAPTPPGFPASSG
jgi:ubiquinone/menaquinone biosynthesis C-methylase UbiE